MKKNFIRETVRIVASTKIDKDGIIEPIWKDIAFNKYPLKRYSSPEATKAIFNLSPCSRNLLDYLVQNMGEDNIANNDKLSRAGFLKYCKALANITYKDDTIKKAFSELAEMKILLPTGYRGKHQVNPLYFFNGTNDRRLRLIRLTNLVKHSPN